MIKRVKENKMIFGMHSIIEAIEAGKDIEKIYLKRDFGGDLAKLLFSKIKTHNIPSQKVPVEKLNAFTEKNHQGAVAFLSEIPYQDITAIIPKLYEEGKTPFVVALDGITDVRNIGAIARTCECAGVDAILVPTYRSAAINADAIKTSAGALYHIPICRADNFVGTINFLKDSGLQVIALSEKANKLYTQQDYSSPIVLVMGAEDIGISQEILGLADSKVRIPINGEIESLNVSVANAIVVYEAIKGRRN